MRNLTQKQLKIMNILWEHGSASTADIHAALQDEAGYARTTVATMLSRLEKKGFIAHEEINNSFVYHPCVEKQDVRKHAVSSLVSSLFAGDRRALLNHLVEEGEVDRSEIDEIQEMLKEKEDTER